MTVHTLKESLDPGVTPIKVHPLGQAEGKDDIILWLLRLRPFITCRDVVTLVTNAW